MKKFLFFFILAVAPFLSFSAPNPTSDTINKANVWYYDSAEQKALYRQVFSTGLDAISSNVDDNKLKLDSWGVIFALEGTLIKNRETQQSLANRLELFESVNLAEVQESATAGAVNATCEIQKMGGRVIVITNRYLRSDSKDEDMNRVIQSLKRPGICYDSLIFANNYLDANKNPRFSAVINGDYENVITTKKLLPLKIVAYFGSDITDFPDFKQSTASEYQNDSAAFDLFGDKYFLLPNPTYGTFIMNGLKR